MKPGVRLAAALILAGLPAVSAAQHPAPRPPADPHQHHHGPEQPAEATGEAHDHSRPHHPQQEGVLPPHIPPITEADRAAAFPDLQGHAVHDRAIHYFVLFDRLEWQGTGDHSGLHLENRGWIGRDVDRLWFRVDGEREDGRLEAASFHALYGRAIAPWWDVVAGVRQDVRPGSPQTWAAIGIQGLAPYWFEVEATAYVGPGARTQFRFETEYEVLLTNRLILQPLVELAINGKADPERGLGAGLSSAEWGLRMRYEIRREFAPYVGVVWDRKFMDTADYARAEGERTGGARLALGLRVWF
jgi:copper resistance protein B